MRGSLGLMTCDGAGVDAERRAAPIDMGVKVDEARRDDLAGHVFHVRARRRETRADRGDLAGCEGDIGHHVDALRWIEHARALEDQVVD